MFRYAFMRAVNTVCGVFFHPNSPVFWIIVLNILTVLTTMMVVQTTFMSAKFAFVESVKTSWELFQKSLAKVFKSLEEQGVPFRVLGLFENTLLTVLSFVLYLFYSQWI